MNSVFERIRYSSNLPARVEIKQGKIAEVYHWHKEIELIYVLDGEVTVTVNNTEQVLCADEFVLINSVENHSLSAENAKCLMVDISYEFAEQFDSSLYNSVFRIIGGSGAEEEIHNLLWQMSRSMKQTELLDLRQYAIITDILHVLFVQCRQENPNTVKDGEKIQSRHAKLAVEYIEQHYREQFTAKGVAKILGIDPIYLSLCFKESMGKTFTEYVMEFRLNRAMDALLNKRMSIDDAAKAGGFPSTRTFIAKCKKEYHITPFQLLKQRAEVKSNVSTSDN